MNKKILRYIEMILKTRSSVIDLAAKQRAKFEGWLKFELADYLKRNGVDTVILEAPYSNMRSDIGFVHNNKKYYLELKTSNTNYRIKGIENKNRPITKNISSIIKDVRKLKECDGIGLVCFMLFPIPMSDDRFIEYIKRISKSINIELAENENYKIVQIENYEVVVCCFEVEESKNFSDGMDIKEGFDDEKILGNIDDTNNTLESEGRVDMYYVYENWRAEKKAVIHKGTCTFCNHGNGTGRNSLGEKNCKWHGEYSSYEEARRKAESLEDREVKDCKLCIK